MADKMFPFLVKERMEGSRRSIDESHLGPGMYETNRSNRQSPFGLKNFNGSSAARFETKVTKVSPAPDQYFVRPHPLLEKSVHTFSTRFSPTAKNIYI
jgi:hypothetical protein